MELFGVYLSSAFPSRQKDSSPSLFVVRLEHCLLKKGSLRRDLVITQNRAGGMTGVFVFALMVVGTVL